jgi:hypothetical protein
LNFGMGFSQAGEIAGNRLICSPVPGSVKGPLDDLLYEERRTTRGVPFTVLRKRMPRVPDKMLDCVFYLYPTVDDAQRGEYAGGTGFLVCLESKRVPGRYFPYLVSNKHVVIEASSPVVRLNTIEGDMDIVPLGCDDWIVHPDGDDLAICPHLFTSGFHRFKAVSDDFFMTRWAIEQLHIGPGEEVFQVGRFINHEGRQQNLPTVRCGTIAMMPHEPIMLHTGHKQECYLVETRTKPGYSGSPVFLQLNFYRSTESGFLVPDTKWKPALLGIAQGILTDAGLVHDEKTQKPWHTDGYKKYIRENTGLEVVIPAWRLVDLLNMPQVVAHREKFDIELSEQVERGSTPI